MSSTEKKKKREKNIADKRPNISITTLNVNSLKTPNKILSPRADGGNKKIKQTKTTPYDPTK